MDAPTLAWLRLNVLPLHVTGKHVLEVGSMDVNGSVRPHIQSLEPASYLGVDIAPGPGVDQVVNVHDLVATLGQSRFDLVVSTEMLEHVEDWTDALLQMKSVLRPGGAMVLTTRRPGFPRHHHPNDYWRFTRNALAAALRDFQQVRVAHVQGRGIVASSWKPDGWRPMRPLVKAHPAPRHELPSLLLQAWVKWIYAGRDPSAKEVPA